MTEYGHFVDQDTWVEWFDGYDKAVIRLILNSVKRDAKAVPCVFASPARAFGQLAKVLNKRKRGVSGSQYTEKTVPLPFMSLTRLDDRFDFDKRWNKAKIRKLQAIDREGNRMPVDMMTQPDDTTQFDAWEQQKFPTPTVIPYQLDGWAKDLRDLDLINKRVANMFDDGDLQYIQVKHPEPWNYWWRPLTWRGFSNNNQLEVQEGDERTLRYTWSFEIDAYILKPSDMVKVVKAAQMDYYDFDTDELIQMWELYDVRDE